MLNYFELEIRMKEQQEQLERTAFSAWAAQIPMLDWLFAASLAATVFSAL